MKNKEIYVSWCRGLPDDKQALEILKNHPLVAGVETQNRQQGCMEKLQAAGLKVAIHEPNKLLDVDLSDPDFMQALKEKGMVDIIKSSDARVTGFHLYYRSRAPYGFNVSDAECDIKKGLRSRQEILDNAADNLIKLEKEINQELADDKKKLVLFETAAYYDHEVLGREPYTDNEKRVVELTGETIKPGFLSELLGMVKHNPGIGFVFDVSHLLTSASTLVRLKQYDGTEEEYMDELIKATKGRVYELHLNLPKGDIRTGLVDSHKPFVPGQKVSEMVFRIARRVLDANPGLSAIALEIDPGLEPVEHARKLSEQAELAATKLGIAKKLICEK